MGRVRYVPQPGFERNLAREPEALAMLRHVAEDSAAAVRAATPVDEGDLFESIEADAGIDIDGIGKGRVNAGGPDHPEAFHAGLVEFGTSTTPPRPYLRTGVQQSVGNVT